MSIIVGDDLIKYIYVGSRRIQSANVGNDNIFASDSFILPNGYTKIRYLQTSERSKIDLRIKADLWYNRFVLKTFVISFNVGSYIFSSGETLSAKYSEGGSMGANNISLTYGNKNVVFEDSISANVYDIDFRNKRYSLTSEYAGLIRSGNLPLSSQHYDNNQLSLGTHQSSNSSVQQRIYSFKIYIMNDIYMNFVPCINTNGYAGLYDTLSGRFTKNQFGSDIAGPVIS